MACSFNGDNNNPYQLWRRIHYILETLRHLSTVEENPLVGSTCVRGPNIVGSSDYCVLFW